ncbi:hypothetical protein [Candidatus Phytoplasma mali]|nr:hypothetical protein [Candidatus Phytoplasma mali]
MATIVKKYRNGNIYYYYETGKIKRISQDGKITWYTKHIFFKHPKSLN